MNTDPPPAAAFVLTFRPSVSDDGLWLRRRWMVAMVVDLCIVVTFTGEMDFH
ncbi:hypothetical protein HanRHA438_Chr14g0644301 [Helianthus annuus]|uniref:Uncharacterized protein n=1 Tax=Helianthus annuus TaxID=4232 RepID=A0A251SJ12_HELAN|nr:hypothetical protein HanXRQr2_Chr14g0633391 [Helianthus annuus]KAJ0484975.1 hypothetical protein HanHA89_Chr14g0562921 [Helianthus annuus]KAJ0655526.1 hypothetical protein HanLR1_Chr14g0525261 [Helianthus annuus]KAJ0659211.1 hypothetical protein HanOQP8_Chr14g0523491 [Helianthus annuus]KAJ0852839.1 hypothetical protein HanRHA438_Chr14g0644301 [Helianthus annuus]